MHAATLSMAILVGFWASTSPLSGFSNPMSILNNVDFPAPLPPIIPARMSQSCLLQRSGDFSPSCPFFLLELLTTQESPVLEVQIYEDSCRDVYGISRCTSVRPCQGLTSEACLLQLSCHWNPYSVQVLGGIFGRSVFPASMGMKFTYDAAWWDWET